MSTSPVSFSSAPAASAPHERRCELQESKAAKVARIVAALALAIIALAAIVAVCLLCPPVLGVLVSLAIAIGALAIALAILNTRVYRSEGYREVHFFNRPIYTRRYVVIDTPRIAYSSPIYVPPAPIYTPALSHRRPAPSWFGRSNVHPGQGHMYSAPRAHRPAPSRPFFAHPPASSTVHLGQGHMSAAPSRFGIGRLAAPLRGNTPQSRVPSRGLTSSTVHLGQGHMRAAPTRGLGAGHQQAPLRGNTPQSRVPFNRG